MFNQDEGTNQDSIVPQEPPDAQVSYEIDLGNLLTRDAVTQPDDNSQDENYAITDIGAEHFKYNQCRCRITY